MENLDEKNKNMEDENQDKYFAFKINVIFDIFQSLTFQ